MWYTRKINGFIRRVNENYEPETNITCFICGYGICNGDEICFSKGGKRCHQECAEKERNLDIKTPDKPSILDWTAREQHEYCKARIAMQGGDCTRSGAEDCLLSAMCCECPDQWEETVE